MRIKNSPVEALTQIDNLVRSGAELLDFIQNDFWEQHEKAEKESMNSEYMSIITTGPRTAVPEEIINGYETKRLGWFNVAENALKEIYKDFSPIYSFSHVKFDINSKAVGAYWNFLRTEAMLEAEIGILVDFYNDLKTLSKSPLNYLPDKAEIWFYDRVVELEPETKESYLCRFMFQFGIGEWKDFDEIYSSISGADHDQWPKNWKKQIINAFDGVNGKTNDMFNFPLFRKEKTVISLNLPRRLM